MKTEVTIALEIATLIELSKLAPSLGSCGLVDNSQNTILAQIDVLAYRLNTDDVHEGYMGKCPDEMFLEVLHASDWAHGLLSAEDDHRPSMEWRDVVKYQEDAELVDERAKAALMAALQDYALECSNELSADIRHTLANYNLDDPLMHDPEVVAAAKAAAKRLHDRASGGVRCHGDACASGQKPCPTPKACGIEGGAQ
jgi:hypothetical protein